MSKSDLQYIQNNWRKRALSNRQGPTPDCGFLCDERVHVFMAATILGAAIVLAGSLFHFTDKQAATIYTQARYGLYNPK